MDSYIKDGGMYLIAVKRFEVITGYVSAGRPCTVRVYNSIKEAQNGIRGNKRFYPNCKLQIVEITTLREVDADGQ